MSWKPVVAGLDASAEAAQAAAFACRIAQAARTRCTVVHATPDPWTALAAEAVPVDVANYRQALSERARREVLLAMRGIDAPTGAAGIIVRLGRPIPVLQQVVRELDAGLLVLGGKHHATLRRWLGGSTTLNAIRALRVPVLVTRAPPKRIERVLAAVDFSDAARPTLRMAERVAALFGATLRAVNVLEPIPPIAEAAFTHAPEYYALWQETLERDVWPAIQAANVDKVVRRGAVVPTLEEEVAGWRADLLVVGSHGKGWADRLLIGSVTERLVNDLPTSLLVVPIGVPLALPELEARPAAEEVEAARAPRRRPARLGRR